MNRILLTCIVMLGITGLSWGQNTTTIRGKVFSQLEDEPLVGVNVLVKGTTKGVVTDADGAFAILCAPEDVLVFSYIGYETIEAPVSNQREITVHLTEGLEMLSAVEVYSTGYQQIPPERATGSFAHVDEALINRSTSTDILSRLESITPGLQFDRRQASDANGNDYRNLRIRGVNSIVSDNSPLIVVDNFPYEGDINNINPNDVESITVLKDAAAASIWGARAANGVIVITTKKGKFDQKPQISLITNVTFGETPDFHYSPRYIESKDFISLERTLFERGYYNGDENSAFKPALSPVVELLIQQRDGVITTEELDVELSRLSNIDVRDEAEEYLYRGSIKQQYALSMSGGSEKARYYFSGGYDKNLSSIKGDEFNRVTLTSNNTFSPVENLLLTAGINYTNNEQLNNGISWGAVETRFPYNEFVDKNGNWLSVINSLRQQYIDEALANGLLDWSYIPLQEKGLSDKSSVSSEQRINTSINYTITDGFNAEIKYQYQKMSGKSRNLQDEESFYVRNLVNKYIQPDGTRIFPEGDILSETYSEQTAHSARGQLNFNRDIKGQHYISALAGAEVREVHVAQSRLQVFGYDDEVLTHVDNLDYTTRFPVLPRGSSTLPRPGNYFEDLTDRYISYYGNVSYEFKEKYMISASARWDGSNLFGVKTNQKGVPLWSAGMSWDISSEQFYNFNALPYLRLRATYGYNGNINKSVTAYPTAAYYTDNITGLPYVRLQSPGNPQLRWERIGLLNLGLDFETSNQRIAGQIEWYAKYGKDILGERPFDPTTGFVTSFNFSNIANYAETRTRGIDLLLQTLNIDGALKWQSDFMISYASNEVIDFYEDVITNSTIISATGGNSSILPYEGNSIDGMYSIPWYGLNGATGDPQIMYEGLLSKEYRDYLQSLTVEDLVYHGPGVAPWFGAIRNTIGWKNISISANISWKAGYFFRKDALSYNQLYNNWVVHSDYSERWQAPGDENFTHVPSMPESPDAYRDIVYTNSEVLVEKGDHIRLEDINVSYTFNKSSQPWLPLENVGIFIYAKNLGILWSATDSGLDPDYPRANYLQPKSISFGINANF